MELLKKRWMEGDVFTLSEDNYSYSIIQRCCESHGVSISKATTGNIVNNKGKTLRSLASSGKNVLNTYPRGKNPVFEHCKGHSVHLEENYNDLSMILEKIYYQESRWLVCGDFKMLIMLLGQQAGYTKYPCFL
ncbi:hypothetical protein AVEN_179463-1 [Araneus ventricosus]|uniref:Uncharacterized protein n=1 Tax=Araneus ventricosus TaxID=182803 RepID=A0A4Y2BG65_ARAVE|nr:hypothetical protein AVEN_179463-1 [Araneus ventricosus]